MGRRVSRRRSSRRNSLGMKRRVSRRVNRRRSSRRKTLKSKRKLRGGANINYSREYDNCDDTTNRTSGPEGSEPFVCTVRPPKFTQQQPKQSLISKFSSSLFSSKSKSTPKSLWLTCPGETAYMGNAGCKCSKGTNPFYYTDSNDKEYIKCVNDESND